MDGEQVRSRVPVHEAKCVAVTRRTIGVSAGRGSRGTGAARSQVGGVVEPGEAAAFSRSDKGTSSLVLVEVLAHSRGWILRV